MTYKLPCGRFVAATKFYSGWMVAVPKTVRHHYAKMGVIVSDTAPSDCMTDLSFETQQEALALARTSFDDWTPQHKDMESEEIPIQHHPHAIQPVSECDGYVLGDFATISDMYNFLETHFSRGGILQVYNVENSYTQAFTADAIDSNGFEHITKRWASTPILSWGRYMHLIKVYIAPTSWRLNKGAGDAIRV